MVVAVAAILAQRLHHSLLQSLPQVDGEVSHGWCVTSTWGDEAVKIWQGIQLLWQQISSQLMWCWVRFCLRVQTHSIPHTAHIVVRFIIQEIVFSMINVIFFLFSGAGFLVLETRNVGDVPPSIYTKKLFLYLIIQNDGISLIYVRYSLKNSCFLFFVKRDVFFFFRAFWMPWRMEIELCLYISHFSAVFIFHFYFPFLSRHCLSLVYRITVK